MWHYFRRCSKTRPVYEQLGTVDDEETEMMEQEILVPEAIQSLGSSEADFYLQLLKRRKHLRRNKVMLVGPGRVGGSRSTRPRSAPAASKPARWT
jgi:hypothetical protein